MTKKQPWMQFSPIRSTVQVFFLLGICFLLFESAQAHNLRISSTQVNKTQVLADGHFEVTYTITNIFTETIPRRTMQWFVYQLFDDSEHIFITGGSRSYSTDGSLYSSTSMLNLPALGPGESLHLKMGVAANSFTRGNYRFKGCISHLANDGTRGGLHDQCGEWGNSLEVITDRSDLSVVHLRTQPDPVMAGELFTLHATVRNDGPGNSRGTTEVHYYRSETDSNQNRNYGNLLNIVDTGGIAPGQERVVSYYDLTGASVGQTQYYFACAGLSPWQNDSDLRNNCSQPIQVSPEAPYELKFTEVSVGEQPNELYGPGENIPLTVKIENSGGGRSPHFYLIVENLACNNFERLIQPIQPGEERTQVFECTTPQVYTPNASPSFTVCMHFEASVTEGRQRNLCSDPITVWVSQSLNRVYDLAFSSVEWQHNLFREDSNNFLLTFNLTNLGQARSGPSTLVVWQSTDASATSKGDDQQLASLAVPGLTPGTHLARQFRPPSDESSDYYYYGCLSDDLELEQNLDNNCSTPILNDVLSLSSEQLEGMSSILGNVFYDPRQRLEVLVSGALMPDDSYTDVVHIGELFNIQADITNISQISQLNVITQFYRSTDSTIDPNTDTRLGSSSQPVDIDSGGVISRYHVVVPTTAGNYYYSACVQSQSATDTSLYKCGNSVPISVVEPVQEIRSAPLPKGIGPQRHSIKTGKHLNKPLPEKVGELIKGKVEDTRTTDKQGVLKKATGLKSALKFRLSGVKASAYQPGRRGIVNVQLMNQGLQTVGPLSVELQISSGRLFKQNRTIEKKVFQELKTKKVARNIFNIAVPRKPGTYYLRACLASEKLCSNSLPLTVKASGGQDIRFVKKDNRKDTSKTTLFSARKKKENPKKKINLSPDLMILSSKPAVGKSIPGRKVKVTATVKNIGTGPSPATKIHLVQSIDKIISKKDTVKNTSNIPSLKPKEQKKVEIYLRAEKVAGSYNYGVCVAPVSNERQKANNCSKVMRLLVTGKKLIQQKTGRPKKTLRTN